MDMTLNQRLDKFLYEKNFTQEQLRIKLGLKNRQQVSNWINCHDHIPDKHLIAIIKLFPELKCKLAATRCRLNDYRSTATPSNQPE